MKKANLQFEESISDDWARDFGVREVPLDRQVLFYVGLAVSAIALVVFGRTAYFAIFAKDLYSTRASMNANQTSIIIAPRGNIVDRYGAVLAESEAVFAAVLNVREFLRSDDKVAILSEAKAILGVGAEDIEARIAEGGKEGSFEPLVLKSELSSSELVSLKALNSPVLTAEESYKRKYPAGPAFAHILGYVGLPTLEELKKNPLLISRESIGRGGVEDFYDEKLRGTFGKRMTSRTATGKPLNEETVISPEPGETLTLSIDAELQKYFYGRLVARLAELQRTSGAGIAIDPRNGEILALVSVPSFDNNIFVTAGQNDVKLSLLNSALRPLFNRAVGGNYNPGSTIKPLEAVAALTEGTITPETTIYSPGYFSIPNPYDPSKPTLIPDAGRSGYINLDSGIARSSNSFFLSVGGGGNGITGLGITKLYEWWNRFGLGKATGIDLRGEAKGFLPTPEWKKETAGRDWLPGDTYNVSIGQGDLLLTPLQLASYISGIASGGTIYVPHLNKDIAPQILADLGSKNEIKRVTQAMEQTVKMTQGTTRSLISLPFRVAAKTGTAQTFGNNQINAIFTGFAPAEDPRIVLMVLIENASLGSENTISVARDVLSWYYQNRLKSED